MSENISRLAMRIFILNIIQKPRCWSRQKLHLKQNFLDDKKEILLINNHNPKQTNIESVIIHELLHIKLWGMDQMIESLLHCVYGDNSNDPKFSFVYTQFMGLLEQTVEDLTKGYKDVGATDKAISFGRIQDESDSGWK